MIPEDRQEDGHAFVLMTNHNELTKRRWKPAPGKQVELRTPGCGKRRGVIEAVMKDHSGFWLAADGAEPRVFVFLDGNEQSIWIAPGPTEEATPK